jgi:hypothetical protein
MQSVRQTAEPIEAIPLSFGQLRLWLLDQLAQVMAVYNMPMALILGSLDREALQRALNILVGRHAALRTRFVCAGEYPAQVIDEGVTVEIPVLQAGGKSEVERLIREEINQPFNLSSDRLLRVKLLQAAPQEHVLIVTMHHIVSDEWSLGIFFNELGQLYQGFAEGRPVNLSDIAVQYADYTTTQRERMQGESLKEHLDYWRERLAGRQGIFEIATDHPRRGISGFRGTIAGRSLGRALTEQCRQLEKRQHITGFMLHLAAFQALHPIQQEDVLVVPHAEASSKPRNHWL